MTTKHGWIVAAALVLPGVAQAQAPAGAADAQRMAQVFETVCLQAFPEPQAVNQAMARLGGAVMAAADVRLYLHDDPGRGWHLVLPDVDYAVTIEEPPYRACAVRRMTPNGFPTQESFDAAVQRYRSAGGRALRPVQRQSVRQPDGLAITGTVQQAAGEGPGGSTDSLMVITSDYSRVRSVPAGVRGVEVRYVHQLRAAGVPP